MSSELASLIAPLTSPSLNFVNMGPAGIVAESSVQGQLLELGSTLGGESSTSITCLLTTVTSD